MSKKGYIYRITSPSGRIYIGQTRRYISNRKSSYRRNHCKGQHLLSNSLKKYGFDSHQFDIIETITSENFMLEILNSLEIFYIGLYKSNIVQYPKGNGMNMTRGGALSKGVISAEARERLRVKNTGEGNPFYGKKHRDETRELMSLRGKGRKLSKKARENISKGHIGNIPGNSIKVLCTYPDGSLYGEFHSIGKALESLNKNPKQTQYIKDYMNKKLLYGLNWRFINT